MIRINILNDVTKVIVNPFINTHLNYQTGGKRRKDCNS